MGRAQGVEVVTDPYHGLREDLRDGAARVAAHIMEAYRPRIDDANIRGWHDRAQELANMMQADIARTTKPFADALATVPAPPVLIEMRRCPDGSFKPNMVVGVDYGR